MEIATVSPDWLTAYFTGGLLFVATAAAAIGLIQAAVARETLRLESAPILELTGDTRPKAGRAYVLAIDRAHPSRCTLRLADGDDDISDWVGSRSMPTGYVRSFGTLALTLRNIGRSPALETTVSISFKASVPPAFDPVQLAQRASYTQPEDPWVETRDYPMLNPTNSSGSGTVRFDAIPVGETATVTIENRLARLVKINVQDHAMTTQASRILRFAQPRVAIIGDRTLDVPYMGPR